MTPLSEKANTEIENLFYHYQGSIVETAIVKIYKQGYNTAYYEFKAEPARLKKENEELRLLCGRTQCEHDLETFNSGWQKCKKCGVIQPIYTNFK